MKIPWFALVMMVPLGTAGFFVIDYYAKMPAAPQALHEAEATLAQKTTGITISQKESLIDQKGHIFYVEGSARVLRRSKVEWEDLLSGDVVETGDVIMTLRESYVDVYFDQSFLNTVRINQNSEVEFQSIEPTNIFVYKGQLFSRMDGLIDGSGFHVITPASVSAVKGTRFMRSFNPWSQMDRTMVIKGEVHVMVGTDERNKNATVRTFRLQEGEQLTFTAEKFDHTVLEGLNSRPMSQPQKIYLMRNLIDSFKELTDFAGGHSGLRQAETEWKLIARDPEAVEAILTQTGMTSLQKVYYLQAQRKAQRRAEAYPDKDKKQTRVFERIPGAGPKAIVHSSSPAKVPSIPEKSVTRRVPKKAYSVNKRGERPGLPTTMEMTDVNLSGIGQGYTGKPRD